MSFNCQIDKIDKAKEPTPTKNQEQNEYDDMYRAHCPEHDWKSYKEFNYPTYERNDKKNYLQNTVLTVKPFIKVHNTTSLKLYFFLLLIY